MQIAACSRSSFASNSACLTRTVIKHHMQTLSVSERRVNSGSRLPYFAVLILSWAITDSDYHLALRGFFNSGTSIFRNLLKPLKGYFISVRFLWAAPRIFLPHLFSSLKIFPFWEEY